MRMRLVLRLVETGVEGVVQVFCRDNQAPDSRWINLPVYRTKMLHPLPLALLGSALEAAAHELLARVARQLLLRCLGIAGLHPLLLCRHRSRGGTRRRFPAQAIAHERFAGIAG